MKVYSTSLNVLVVVVLYLLLRCILTYSCASEWDEGDDAGPFHRRNWAELGLEKQNAALALGMHPEQFVRLAAWVRDTIVFVLIPLCGVS